MTSVNTPAADCSAAVSIHCIHSAAPDEIEQEPGEQAQGLAALAAGSGELCGWQRSEALFEMNSVLSFLLGGSKMMRTMSIINIIIIKAT